MEKAVTKSEFMKVMDIVKRITDEIRPLKPKAEAVLQSFNAEEFKRKVCNHIIGYKENEEFEFECCYFNRRYFDKINTATEEEKRFAEEYDKPVINVWYKGGAKFAVLCPYAGSHICKLRNFFYENRSQEKTKRAGEI